MKRENGRYQGEVLPSDVWRHKETGKTLAVFHAELILSIAEKKIRSVSSMSTPGKKRRGIFESLKRTSEKAFTILSTWKLI